MPSSISFRGRNLYLPSVVVDINNQLLASESLDAKNMCVIGHFPKLKPKTANVFKNGSGPTVPELYPTDYEMLLLNKMFQSPIKDSTAAAASLTYVNAGSETIASNYINGRHLDGVNAFVAETIVGANPGANETFMKAIKLESLTYGAEGNNIRFKSSVNAADLDAFYKLNTIFGADAAEEATGAQEQFNITPVANKKFKMWITGGEKYSRGAGANQVDEGTEVARYLNIELYADGYDDSGNGSAIFATQSVSLVGDFDADVVAINADKATDTAAALATVQYALTDYASYDALAQALSNAVISSGGVDYPLNTYFAIQATNYDAGAVPKNLDAVYHEQDASGSAKMYLTAHIAEFERYVKVLASAGFYPVNASIVGWPIVLENMAEFRDLSGGTTVAPLDADFEAALDAVRTKDIQLITCLTTDTDTTKAMSLHLDEVLAYSRDRQGFAGAPAGSTIDQAYGTVVSQFANKHMAVCNQSMSVQNHNGDVVDLGPEYFAFLMMCMQGAIPYAQPLTGLRPNLVSTEENFNRELEVDKLIRKCQLGVYLAFDNELKIARGISSYNKDNETINCEMSARESILGAGRFLRSILTKELGSKVLSGSTGRIINLVNTRCKRLKDEGIIKNFRNIQVSIVDDTAFITLDLAVIAPLNFVEFTFNISDF